MVKQKPPAKEQKLSEGNLLFILAGIAFLLFANTINHGFVLDDVAVIGRNKFVHKGVAGWPDIFTSFYWQGFWDLNTGLYRPLSLAMFALEWQIMPDAPIIHHVINILIYALTAVLLYKFLVKLCPGVNNWIFFFTTLLFIVHPLHTEVVANIKSRDELLCFLFFLISAGALINERLQGGKYIFISCSTYLLALFSKEAAITFIPVFALILYFFRGFSWRQIAGRLMPLVIIAVVWLGFRYYVIHQGPALTKLSYIDNSILGCTDFFSQTATAISIAGHYLLKCFLPFTLAYDYSYNQIPCESFGSPSVIISMFVFLFLFYLSWIYRKTRPIISFGILYFFITFSLSSNIVLKIGTTMADRLLFTPSLGILLAAVCALFTFIKSGHSSLKYICIVVAGIFAFKAFNRNKDWKSDIDLYLADIEKSPNSDRVNYNYATALLGMLPVDEQQKQTQLTKIVKHLTRSTEIDKTDHNAYANLGVAYFKQKDYGNSVKASKKAISLNASNYVLFGNLADALFMDKQYDSALYYYKICIAKNVIFNYTYNYIGTAYFIKKDFKTAIINFEKGISLYPDYAETWLNYGNALASDGQFIKAIEAFEKAYSLNPANKQALYFISVTYNYMGDKAKAAEYYQRFKN